MKACYAARHGYSFIADTDPELTSAINPWWGKAFALQRHLPHFDWVVWMDADVTITNTSVPLEWFLPPYSKEVALSRFANPQGSLARRVAAAYEPGAGPLDADVAAQVMPSLVFTDQSFALNNGVQFVRNDAWTHTFISRWIEEGRRVHKAGARWFQDDQGAQHNMLMRVVEEEGEVEGMDPPPRAPTAEGPCGSIEKELCCTDKVQRCTNSNLERLGHPFQHRSVPHAHFIDPASFPVLDVYQTRAITPVAKVIGTVVGAFDQYMKELIPRWVTQHWDVYSQWKRGMFGLHIHNNAHIKRMVPLPVARGDCTCAFRDWELPSRWYKPLADMC